MGDLDNLEWIKARTKTDMDRALTQVLEGLAVGDNAVLEQFIAHFQLDPADFDKHSDEVVEQYIKKYLLEDEDWKDPSNWGSMYILGVLVGFLMRRERDEEQGQQDQEPDPGEGPAPEADSGAADQGDEA